MAAVDAPAPAASKGSSIVIQLAVLLVMTVAAVGLGWFSGSYLNGEAPKAAAPAPPAHGADAGAGHGAAGDPAPAASSGAPVVDLPAITTNLAAPSEIWVRMELSLQFDQAPGDSSLIDAIHQDLLAFMRTVKMHQVEGASGFLHLKADLTDRASIRSGGHVKAVLIRTLLFE